MSSSWPPAQWRSSTTNTAGPPAAQALANRGQARQLVGDRPGLQAAEGAARQADPGGGGQREHRGVQVSGRRRLAEDGAEAIPQPGPHRRRRVGEGDAARLPQDLAERRVDDVPARRGAPSLLQQQVAGVQLDRGRQVPGVGGRLERVDVDPQPRRLQPQQLVAQREMLRRQRLAREMHGLAEVGGGGGGCQLRPEQVHQLLAVQAVARGQRQQLHHRLGLVPPPGPVGHRPRVDLDPELPEQPDPQLRGHRPPLSQRNCARSRRRLSRAPGPCGRGRRCGTRRERPRDLPRLGCRPMGAAAPDTRSRRRDRHDHHHGGSAAGHRGGRRQAPSTTAGGSWRWTRTPRPTAAAMSRGRWPSTGSTTCRTRSAASSSAQRPSRR
jgi:hypothetical protein